MEVIPEDPEGGGSPGEVRLVFGSNIGREAVKISASPGRPGSPGKGGEAGKFQQSSCTRRIRKISGKPGKSLPYIKPVFVQSKALPEDHLADGFFPARPPTPSARLRDLQLDLPANPTMAMVKNKLTIALHKVGYEERYNILRWRDGFALITNMELIEGESVAPVAETSVRWSERIKYRHTPSIVGYLRSIIYPIRGYGRVTVFLVGSPGDLLNTTHQATKEEALNWFREGGGSLPEDLLQKPFSAQMRVNALIYEFSRKENAKNAEITPPTRKTARKHLAASSGLLQLISRQK
jgi:hypothetical protein